LACLPGKKKLFFDTKKILKLPGEQAMKVLCNIFANFEVNFATKRVVRIYENILIV